MVSNADFDTDLALLSTRIFETQLSDYSSVENNILQVIGKEQVPYGIDHFKRPINRPDRKMTVDRFFNPKEDKIEIEFQNLDIPCLSKRLVVPKETMANKARGVSKHLKDYSEIVKDNVEDLLFNGVEDKVVSYGIKDIPGATAGTKDRPERLPNITTAGDWNTTANVRTDLINAIIEFESAKFFGPKVIFAPNICKPMLTELIANTKAPIREWVKSTFGVQVAYSPFVDIGCDKDSFDIYIIDLSRVFLGLSDLHIDVYYENKDHAYYWDYEIWASALFDPLFNQTNDEWEKGVVCIPSVDWSD